MTGNTVHAAEAAYRKKRVKRIKKIIVGTAIVLLLLPTIMCLFLLVKVHSLEKQIETITKVSDSGVVKAQEKEVKTTKAPKKASTAEPTIKPTDDTTTKKVYLTFDDGPDPGSTPILLDLLAKYQVHATFFVVANSAQKYPELIHRMQAEGHHIGFHSNAHCSAYLMPPTKTKRDFQEGLSALHSAGVSSKLFRPPWGVVNWESLRQIRKNKLQTVLWDIMAQDWQANISAEEIARRLDARTWPGAVICLHDGRGAPGATLRTIQALHIQLPRWREAGFIFLTLEE